MKDFVIVSLFCYCLFDHLILSGSISVFFDKSLQSLIGFKFVFQIFGFLLAYYFIRHVENVRVWYRVDNYKA